MGAGAVEIVRASERFVTRRPGIVTTHEFSFGEHYDPTRTSYGTLVAHNVEMVAPGSGFEAHRHDGVEILTWVVSGRLRHEDGAGHVTVLGPGGVQRLDAAGGAEHSETNAASGPGGEPVTFVQMWLRVDDDPASTVELPPAYQYADLAEGDLSAELVPIAGSPDAVLGLRSPGLALSATLLDGRTAATIPPASRAHLYVVRGRLELVGATVGTGDSVHLTDVDHAGVTVTADGESLVLVLGWP